MNKKYEYSKIGLSKYVKIGRGGNVDEGEACIICGSRDCHIVCSGCAQDEGKSSSATTVPESFLKEVFTTDFEKRYTEFQKDNDTEKYYDTFSDCASEACIEAMSGDRMPLKYDKKAEENSAKAKVLEVKCEVDEDGEGEFEVLLGYEKDEDKKEKATGQITVIEEDGKEKVDSFFLSNIVEVK